MFPLIRCVFEFFGARKIRSRQRILKSQYFIVSVRGNARPNSTNFPYSQISETAKASVSKIRKHVHANPRELVVAANCHNIFCIL